MSVPVPIAVPVSLTVATAALAVRVPGPAAAAPFVHRELAEAALCRGRSVLGTRVALTVTMAHDHLLVCVRYHGRSRSCRHHVDPLTTP